MDGGGMTPAAAAAARLGAYARVVRALREAEGAPPSPGAALSPAQREALFSTRVAQLLFGATVPAASGAAPAPATAGATAPAAS